MRIFISYRRDDSAGEAGWLYDRLSARYASQSVFMDVSRIEPGADFAEAIGSAVGKCDVMLAVIGRKWTAGRRIDDANDFVRLEIVSALKRGIAVVAVLVDGAARPIQSSLPTDLAALAHAAAVELREQSWDEDIARLMALLDAAEGKAVRKPKPGVARRAMPAALAGVALLAAIAARQAYLRGIQAGSRAALSGEKTISVAPSATLPSAGPRALATLPYGRLAAATANGIVIWNLAEKAPTPVVLAPEKQAMAILSLPGELLAWGTRSGDIQLWDWQHNKPQALLAGHRGPVAALAALSDSRLASASWDTTVRVWNIADGKPEKTLTGHTNQARALAALGGARLASGSSDGAIILWNLQGELEKRRILDRHGTAVSALLRLSDERFAVGSEDGRIEIWNATAGNLETSVRAHTDWVNALAILPDGRLASASDDRTIAVWDPSKRVPDARLEGHTGRVNALAVLADGRLVSGSDDGTLRLWTMKRKP